MRSGHHGYIYSSQLSGLFSLEVSAHLMAPRERGWLQCLLSVVKGWPPSPHHPWASPPTTLICIKGPACIKGWGFGTYLSR